MLRVTQVARQLNIHPSTVRKHTGDGGWFPLTIHPVTGERVYYQEDVDRLLGVSVTPVRVFYVRSSSGDKVLKEAQVEALTEAYGEPVKVYSDSGSGLNENRKGLQRLLRDAGKGKFTEVCVTYPDRLTRFGYSYLEALLRKDNVKVSALHSEVVMAPGEELMQDFMNLIASFSGKFYRMRGRKEQKQLLLEAQGKLDE